MGIAAIAIVVAFVVVFVIVLAAIRASRPRTPTARHGYVLRFQETAHGRAARAERERVAAARDAADE